MEQLAVRSTQQDKGLKTALRGATERQGDQHDMSGELQGESKGGYAWNERGSWRRTTLRRSSWSLAGSLDFLEGEI